MATGVLLKEFLKNTKTKANILIIEIKQLGLEVKLLKIKVIIYYRIRIESPIRGEMVIVNYIVKIS